MLVEGPLPDAAGPGSAAEARRIAGVSSVAAALDVVGDLWMLRILGRLFMNARSWSAISDGLAISPTTLSTRLRQLADARCVERGDSYELTERGRDLFPAMAVIDEWRLRWEDADGSLRSPWDHACGAPLRVRSVCRHCQAEVRMEDVRFTDTGAPPRTAPGPASRHFRNAQAPVAAQVPGERTASRILQVIGDRRAVRVHAALTRGNARFEELLSWTGLHPAILSDRLRKLQLLDFAHMRLYQESPDRYHYGSSIAGRDSYDVSHHLMQWADRWIFAPDEVPVVTTHKPCGHRLHADLVCTCCDGAVDITTVSVARPGEDPFMI